MSEFMVKMVSFSPIGKLATKYLRAHGLDFLKVPLEKVSDKQDKLLQTKLRRLSGTTIGKKIGLKESFDITSLQFTNYEFYKPFFDAPTQDAFMYPLEDYVRSRTSGSSGVPKWYMHPGIVFHNSHVKTGMAILVALLHDEGGCTLDYGDTIYVNVAPPPFPAGYILPKVEDAGIIRIVPNMHLPYKDKIRYFVLNPEKISAAVMLTSALLTQVMPELKEPVELKGLMTLDSVIAEANIDALQSFFGVPPKTTYSCTETSACTVPSVQYPLGFIFDWRRNLFQLQPIKKGEVSNETLVGIDEVRTGETYQMVFTSFESELTKYVLEDTIRCVAMGDDHIGTDHPVFKFGSRIGKNISLHNFTRIDEDEILSALSKAKIHFVDFTARGEVEGGREYLKIYLEHSSGLSPEEIALAINEQLYADDVDFLNLAEFFEYNPTKVSVIPKGAFAKYLEDIPAGSIPKVDRISMNEEKFKRFMEVVDRYGGIG